MWGNIIGGAISGIGSFLGAQQSNKAAKQIAREQMEFQEEMSNTAYQRATADMRAAGINPMLAAQNGGASTPPGASADIKNELGPAISSAMQGAAFTTQLEQLRANVAQTQAQTAQTEANTNLQVLQAVTEQQRPSQVAAQTGLTQAQTGTERFRPGLIGAQTREHSARAIGSEQENQRFENYGPRTTPADYAANAEALLRRGARNIPTGEGGTSQPERRPDPPRNPTEQRRAENNAHNLDLFQRALRGLERLIR